MYRMLLSLSIGLLANTVGATTFNLPDENTRVVGHNLVVYSHHEDTLLDIARQFDLGYREIVSANPNVDPWLPGENTRVLVPNRFILPDLPQEGIVINLAEMRLYYYPKSVEGQSRQVITHPIGIGREGWSTPLGKARIIQKVKDPTWTPPESIRAEHLAKGDPLPKVVPAGPDNPLGAYKMRLSIPGYLLHGTNRPYGVGMRVSHGCIRLFPEDIEELFGVVAVNTPVEIISKSYKAALDNDALFLEAHEHQEDISALESDDLTVLVSAIIKTGAEPLDDTSWTFAEKVVNKHNGVVQQLNHKLLANLIDDVWFIHAGVSPDTKIKLAEASTSLNLNDYFWPMQGAAEGEVLIGPFENKEEADKVALEIKRLVNISVWTTLVSSDAL